MNKNTNKNMNKNTNKNIDGYDDDEDIMGTDAERYFIKLVDVKIEYAKI
jgi:hypothetical protein